MGLRVLSICGGLETGLLALKELGIPVDEYHTYEIFAPAIELSKRHFPEVQHHGDVIGADFSQFKGFDLVIAGTCCQSLSKLRQENKDICSGLKGKSGIFFEYARAVQEIKPRWYMLENVVPKNKTDQDTITATLGGQTLYLSTVPYFQHRSENVCIGVIFLLLLYLNLIHLSFGTL